MISAPYACTECVLHHATDLLLEELALNSARPDNASENKSSDAAGGEVKTKAQTL